MKKLILCMTILLVLMLTLCACATKTEDTPFEHLTLGDYLGVTIEMDEEELTVTDEDVQEEIDAMLTYYTDCKEITDADREAKEGDLLTIDYEGKIDGEAFEGGTDEGAEIILGSSGYIPGFDEGLVGMKTGEVRDLELTFPDPYEINEELSGKAVVFTVTLQKISEEVIPEYTDDFVLEQFGYSTTEEYSAYIKSALEEERETSFLEEKRTLVWDKVMEGVTFQKEPEEEIEQYYQKNYDMYASEAEEAGEELGAYLESVYGVSLEEFETQLREWAEEDVKCFLVSEAIAEQEGISISDEEYEEGLTSYITGNGFASAEEFEEQYGVSFEEYAGGKEQITKYLLADKVLELVTDAAVIQ